MTRTVRGAVLAALLLAPLLAAPRPAASQAGEGSPASPGAVVVRQSLCKISVGQTLADGTDEVYTFDCSTVLTPSATGVSTLRAKASVAGWTGGTYRDSGFPCIINRQPIGGESVCTTNSRTVINAAGKASLNCQCKLTDPTCTPVVAGRTPCAP
jgi:hypothetical protein